MPSELDADQLADQVERENDELRELLVRAWSVTPIPTKPEGFPPCVGTAHAAVFQYSARQWEEKEGTGNEEANAWFMRNYQESGYSYFCVHFINAYSAD